MLYVSIQDGRFHIETYESLCPPAAVTPVARAGLQRTLFAPAGMRVNDAVGAIDLNPLIFADEAMPVFRWTIVCTVAYFLRCSLVTRVLQSSDWAGVTCFP